MDSFQFEVVEGIQKGISTTIPADVELVVGGRDECDICLLDMHLDHPLLTIRIDSLGGFVCCNSSDLDGECGKINFGEVFLYGGVSFRIISTKSTFLISEISTPDNHSQSITDSPQTFAPSFYRFECRKRFFAPLCLSLALWILFNTFSVSFIYDIIVKINSDSQTSLLSEFGNEIPNNIDIRQINIKLRELFPSSTLFIARQNSDLILKGFLVSSSDYFTLRQFIKSIGTPISILVKIDSEVNYQVESWKSRKPIFRSAIQYRGSGLILVAPFLLEPPFQSLIKDFAATFPFLNVVPMGASDMALVSEEVQGFLRNGIDPTIISFFKDGFFNISINKSDSSIPAKFEALLRSDPAFSFLPYLITITTSSHLSGNKRDLANSRIKSVGATPALPFQISSIFGGPTPWVYTKENERIQVGGFHRGYRLVHVGDSELTFEGKHRITVPR